MTYTLTQLPPAPFAGRDGLVALSGFFGNPTESLMVYGGWNQNDPVNFPHISNNETWKCNNLAAGNWTLIRKNGQWSPRHNFHVYEDFGWGTHLYGSDVQGGRYVNDHWYTGNLRDFKLVEQDCPWGPRVLSIGASFGNNVLIIGGQTVPAYCGPGSELIEYRDIWGYERGSGRGWEKLADDLPCLPRGMIDKAVVHDGELYLIGGGQYEPRQYDSQVWRTIGGNLNNWEMVSEGQFHPRGYHNVCSWDGKLWIIGGHSTTLGNMGDVLCSADCGETWQNTGMTVPARHAAALVVYQDKLTLIGGNGSPMKNDVWQISRAAP